MDPQRKHFSKLRKAHHQSLLRVFVFQRRRCATDATPAYAKAFKMTSSESIGTTIGKWRLVSAAAVGRRSKKPLSSRLLFGTMAGGENLKPGGQFETWHRCVLGDLREFRAIERSTEHSPLVLELRPRCGPLQLTRRGSGTGGSLKQPNGSW